MNNKGFTLIEILAVLVILSMAALIVVPNIHKTVDQTKDTSFASNAKIITSKANGMYKQEKYKNNTNIFIENKIYLKDIVDINNISDPYGGEFDKEKSFVEFKNELVDTVNVTKTYIYLISCKGNKCHRIGTANEPVSDDVLTNKDVVSENKK